MRLNHSTIALCFTLPLLSILCSCVETSLDGGTASGPTQPAETNLTKEDIELRFLTAYIKGDPSSARRYATDEAIQQIPWVPASSGYLPYFDDKDQLHFAGGLAQPTFSEVDGQLKITHFKVHKKRSY